MKKRPKRTTLYDARWLEKRLDKVPDTFRDLFRDAYISTRKLRAGSSAGGAPPGLFQLVDRACDEWARTARPACAAGCAWCCRQDVLMAPFEFEAVREAVEAAGIADVVRRKLAASDAGPTIHADGRDLPVSPCPLLDDAQLCMVYPSRPLSCRSTFAMNADNCRAACEAALAGDADATYDRAGDPAVIGIAAREAVHAGRRVFLRDMLREYLNITDA